MPLVRIDTTQRFDSARRRAFGDATHRALVETLNVPAEDRFQIISGHPDDDLNVSSSYLGISHGKDLVIVQVTLNAGRSVELKRAFYARLADELQALGVRREDVLVSLVEVTKENWSWGNGEAQYAKP
jgi:phenylpyruvate tautomerase PptA (4-oxalocrotonate tautomerase family)